MVPFFNAFVEVFSSLRQNNETQLTLTCSKLTKKNTRRRCEICLQQKRKVYNKNTGACFTPISSVSIVDIEQVNVSCVKYINFKRRGTDFRHTT